MAILVLCALGLVTSQDRARKLFVELERAQNQMRQLDIQANQLEIEQSKISKSSLVDGKARRELSMRPVEAERTLHVNMSGAIDRQAMQAQEAKANR
jgi:cell division protein FtsL